MKVSCLLLAGFKIEDMRNYTKTFGEKRVGVRLFSWWNCFSWNEAGTISKTRQQGKDMFLLANAKPWKNWFFCGITHLYFCGRQSVHTAHVFFALEELL